MKEELFGSTREDYITLNGMCVGRDEHTLFAADDENAAVKRIEMRSKQTSSVYKCDSGYSVCDLVWMSENVAAVETIAALVATKQRSHMYSVLVLEGDEKRMEITQRCDLNETAQYEGGRLVELRGGELAVKGNEMRNVHVWRRGEQSANTYNISGERYKTYGMCVIEKVLGRQEIITLAFFDDSSIGMFEIEQNQLVSIKYVSLEFTPFQLLWIASKQIFFINKLGGNAGDMCVLRVTADDVRVDRVALEPTQMKINVSCWCVLRDETGGEQALALFDYKSESVMMFELN